MNQDTTFYYDGTFLDGHYVTVPVIRQSDTTNFLLQNNDWKLLEPKGTTPAEPLESYLASRGSKVNELPLDGMVRSVMVGNSYFLMVMIPVLAWIKIKQMFVIYKNSRTIVA